jgi:DNA topoisomerase IB
VPTRFEFVSPDQRIVGGAKYYTVVGGVGLPPAKFSIIAEQVWLLERTNAAVQFLVFGNDRSVPVQWLKRYGHLASQVEFFYLTDAGQLENLR